MHITIEADSIQELDAILSRFQVKKDALAQGYDVRKDPKAGVKKIESEKRKYAKVDVNDIYRLKKAGKTAKEIADELGCGYSTVCKKLAEVF